jgi:hypothetical protein
MRIRTLPGERDYDRKERKAWSQDARYALTGCGIVVLIVVLTYVVYAIALFASGWKGT